MHASQVMVPWQSHLRRKVRHRLADVIHKGFDLGIQNGLQCCSLLGVIAALLAQGSNVTALLLDGALQISISLLSSAACQIFPDLLSRPCLTHVHRQMKSHKVWNARRSLVM